jgi:hypothetical protein
MTPEHRLAIEIMHYELKLSPHEIQADFGSKGVPLELSDIDSVISNRMRSSETVVVYNGDSKTITEWQNITGINKWTIKQRLMSGWRVEDALTTPVKKCRNNKSTFVRRVKFA